MDELLQYYKQELSFLKQQGESFAATYPKIASRIRLGSGAIEDPFVARLIESFAFLTARLHQYQDEQLNFITENLLHLIYPHYLLPIPSMTIVEFHANKNLDSVVQIKRHSTLSCEATNGLACEFRNIYPIELKPLKIDTISLSKRFPINSLYQNKTIQSCLSLHLSVTANNLNLKDANLNDLSFYINGQALNAYLFYDFIFNEVDHIVLSNKQRNKFFSYPKENIQKIGLSKDEALLPYPANSFSGYCLLSEFAAFPQKFLFFSLKNLNQYLNDELNDQIEIHFFMKKYDEALAKEINQHFLKLHCSPIINLFSTTSEPFTVSASEVEYQIIANKHRPLDSIEIYSIENMTLSQADDADIECFPYFGEKDLQITNKKIIYWLPQRKYGYEILKPSLSGYEMFVKFHDQALYLSKNEKLYAQASLLCTNRELASQLPFGGDQPKFYLNSAQESIAKIIALQAMTKPIYRDKKNLADKELIAHLNLDQFSFSDPKKALKILKSILNLYHFDQKHASNWIDEALIEMKIKPVVSRHPDQLKFSFCHGVEIDLQVDEKYFSDKNLYIFGCILAEFLTQSTTLNSFTRLKISCKHNGEVYQWQEKLGKRQTV